MRMVATLERGSVRAGSRRSPAEALISTKPWKAMNIMPIACATPTQPAPPSPRRNGRRAPSRALGRRPRATRPAAPMPAMPITLTAVRTAGGRRGRR
jgi:hypothetical protein